MSVTWKQYLNKVACLGTHCLQRALLSISEIKGSVETYMCFRLKSFHRLRREAREQQKAGSSRRNLRAETWEETKWPSAQLKLKCFKKTHKIAEVRSLLSLSDFLPLLLLSALYKSFLADSSEQEQKFQQQTHFCSRHLAIRLAIWIASHIRLLL